jgi:hypothetical protein
MLNQLFKNRRYRYTYNKTILRRETTSDYVADLTNPYKNFSKPLLIRETTSDYVADLTNPYKNFSKPLLIRETTSDYVY